MSLLVKGVSSFGKVVRNLSFKETTPFWKKYKLPAPHHGDFRPDLLQDVDLFHLHGPFYQKWTDSVRVRMAYRKMGVEENTKYIPQVYNIVDKKVKEYLKTNNVDLSNVTISEIRTILPDILSELSHNVFLSEHRLRYQSEQRNRHFAAIAKFNSRFYSLNNKTLEEFVKDYNKFLWFEIKKSHLFQSPKIEANYRRNYHEGEVSPVTSLIFYLYFKTDKVKNFFGKLLLAAYRNPYTDRRVNL